MPNYIKNLFSSKDVKLKKIRLYTFINIFFKLLGFGCTFLIIPLTLNYIGKSEYGVWLTLTSLISWLSYMDIGLGNGMRNKVAASMARNDKNLANQYVSTTYCIFSVLILFLFLIIGFLNFFLDWNSILKTSINSIQLLIITFIVLFCFCLRLLGGLAITTIIALQKVHIEAIVNFIINFSTLGLVYFLPNFFKPSFFIYCISLSLVPVIVILIFNFYLFKVSDYSFLKPTIKNFQKIHVKGLLNVGLQFFIIQFVGIIIFSTDNILISHLFSPADVTNFNIAYKYFSIATIGFSIILSPYWGAFTHSYINKDFIWIKKAFEKLLTFWVFQVIIVFVMILMSSEIYLLWLKNKISISYSLSIFLGINALINNWNNIFAYFINSVSKIRLQLISSIIAGLLNIPLSIFLVKYTNLGLSSIVLANSICLFISSIWSPIQCIKILNNKAYGIWNL